MITIDVDEQVFKNELKEAYEKHSKEECSFVVSEHCDLQLTTAYSIVSEYYDFTDFIDQVWNRLTLFEV